MELTDDCIFSKPPYILAYMKPLSPIGSTRKSNYLFLHSSQCLLREEDNIKGSEKLPSDFGYLKT